MQVIETDNLEPQQREAVHQLWNSEYPAQLAYKTIGELDNYLDKLGAVKHYLLVNGSGVICAWAFTFLRDSERWFGIILDNKIQGQGNGRLLLNRLKEEGQTLNGWVSDHGRDLRQNGEPYKSPLGFYEKNGFTICHDIRLEIEILSAVKISWQK